MYSKYVDCGCYLPHAAQISVLVAVEYSSLSDYYFYLFFICLVLALNLLFSSTYITCDVPAQERSITPDSRSMVYCGRHPDPPISHRTLPSCLSPNHLTCNALSDTPITLNPQPSLSPPHMPLPFQPAAGPPSPQTSVSACEAGEVDPVASGD